MMTGTQMTAEENTDTAAFMEQVLRTHVYNLAIETPLQEARTLSRHLNNRILFKREDHQPIYSFKLRGACQKISSLSDEEKARGIITVSAGNHAQGVAYTAHHLGLRAVVVMPEIAPQIKVESVRDWGSEVILYGQNVTEAEQHARKLQQEQNLTFVHPYDDPLVIAGQATVGLELLRQAPAEPYTVFIPVGGGGLIAGIATVLKAIRPDIRVVGVEPENADAMIQSIQAGQQVRLEHLDTFVDAVAVKQAGFHPFTLAQKHVDDWVTVSNHEVCLAIRDIYNDTRTFMEPGGALGTAGMKKYVQEKGLTGQTLITITSGANADFDRIREVAQRLFEGQKPVGRVLL
ncbi:threonine ammonia-lyase, biosynthetic [Deinococcus cellulosilyticus]|uniref:L-threonine dehydratase n=1 Tax=Deinococcus cellulosilyticus (strain DSM 18568 / NBRC 106333 / KACC 11606 / 5516J-15) TaxID=1223518 RepID=A0A511N7Y8_DEIC1|nr:threonine ammonia-lyase, biosynthetic [Deinococcus cellulosilyticus]GEM48608.1 hypothetical protein DC3_42430 [Deinococcus cellulosilyticus NBRC 106333 = KACC 11606]